MPRQRGYAFRWRSGAAWQDHKSPTSKTKNWMTLFNRDAFVLKFSSCKSDTVNYPRLIQIIYREDFSKSNCSPELAPKTRKRKTRLRGKPYKGLRACANVMAGAQKIHQLLCLHTAVGYQHCVYVCVVTDGCKSLAWPLYTCTQSLVIHVRCWRVRACNDKALVQRAKMNVRPTKGIGIDTDFWCTTTALNNVSKPKPSQRSYYIRSCQNNSYLSFISSRQWPKVSKCVCMSSGYIQFFHENLCSDSTICHTHSCIPKVWHHILSIPQHYNMHRQAALAVCIGNFTINYFVILALLIYSDVLTALSSSTVAVISPGAGLWWNF